MFWCCFMRLLRVALVGLLDAGAAGEEVFVFEAGGVEAEEVELFSLVAASLAAREVVDAGWLRFHPWVDAINNDITPRKSY